VLEFGNTLGTIFGEPASGATVAESLGIETLVLVDRARITLLASFGEFPLGATLALAVHEFIS
jgi:hypothetical protein